MKHLSFSIFSLIIVLGSSMCMAQQKPATARHSPNATIVFEDDFSKDIPGKLPSHWIYSDTVPPLLFVKKEAKGNSLAIEQRIYGQSIEPDVDITHTDQLEISFDFLLEQNSDVILDFCFNKSEKKWIKGHYLWIRPGETEHSITITDYDKKSVYGQKVTVPVEFARGIWHHFSYNYNEGQVKYFVNNHKVLSQTDTTYYPRYCSVGIMGFARFTNFKLVARTNDKSINSLLTENKLVTHAINFDVNSSVVKQESQAFVKQLADLLAANPSIKLEVDGHTDNDGNAGNNMRLSIARAEEVKKQLISYGIDPSRLTAKGFGATQPIQPNTTPESKANNRRVEFIRH